MADSLENTNIHAHNAAGKEVRQTEKQETVETRDTTEYGQDVTEQNRNGKDLDRQESRQNNRWAPCNKSDCVCWPLHYDWMQQLWKLSQYICFVSNLVSDFEASTTE